MRPIPTPKSLPLLGTMLSIMAAGGAPKLHLYVDRRHKELGPIYREKIGPVSGVFISDGNYMRKIFALEGKYPKHVVPESWLHYNNMYGCKRGLLFMDDEEWLHFRKIMNKIMLKVRQDVFYTAANAVAVNLVDNWKSDTQIVNLEKRLYKWSLEVIVAILIGVDNHSKHKRQLSPLVDQLARIVHQIFVESATLSLVPVKIAVKLKFPAWRRFVSAASSAVERGNELVDKIINIEKSNPDKECLVSEMSNAGMDLDNMKRIVTDLILAAGDTSAHTTQWLLHLLSTNLQSQNLIFDQMKQFPEDHILQYPLLKGALKEALRLYPVAPFITRFMPHDVVLDDFQIKAQELVLMSLYSSGRNETYFPQANTFSPQRWLRNRNGYEGVTNANASMPFAMGSRSCIGKKVAETQILVLISKILQNFIVKSEKGDTIEMKLHLISVPSEPIVLRLEAREQNTKTVRFNAESEKENQFMPIS